MIVRFGPPSKMDYAPYHSICKVANSGDTVEFFLQISHDDENPNWISIGEFPNTVSDEHVHSLVVKK